jgi:hypothetical protein
MRIRLLGLAPSAARNVGRLSILPLGEMRDHSALKERRRFELGGLS